MHSKISGADHQCILTQELTEYLYDTSCKMVNAYFGEETNCYATVLPILWFCQNELLKNYSLRSKLYAVLAFLDI